MTFREILKTFLWIFILTMGITASAYPEELGHWTALMGHEPAEEHTYHIKVDQDGTVEITVSCQNSMTSQYTVVTLKDRYNKEIGRMYVMSSPSRKNFFLAPGDFTVIIGKYRSDIYGTYVMTANLTPANPGSMEGENNDIKDRASPVNSPVISGSIGYQYTKDEFDRTDWFAMDIVSGGQLEVEIDCSQSLQSQYSTLEIFDSSNNKVGFATLYPGKRTFNIKNGGIYYFKVFVGRTDLHGAYQFNISLSGGNPLAIKGDANGDGKLNIVDALMTARYAVKLGVTSFHPESADVNCDKIINIIDALMIARKAVQLNTPGWCK